MLSATNSPTLGGLDGFHGSGLGRDLLSDVDLVLDHTLMDHHHHHSHHHHHHHPHHHSSMDVDDLNLLSAPSIGGIGMLHSSHNALSSNSDPILPQSNSPLMLSISGAPLIGSMPSLDDLMDSSNLPHPHPATAENTNPNHHSHSNTAAATRVHTELESLIETKRKIEADLQQELAKKKSSPHTNATTATNTTTKKSKKQSQSNNTTTAAGGTGSHVPTKRKKAAAAAAGAGASTVPNSPAMTGSASDSKSTSNTTPAGAATNSVAGEAHPPSTVSSNSASTSVAMNALNHASILNSLQPSALLAPDILTSVDLAQLTQAMDSLANMFSAASQTNILPRLLKLSLPEVEKEIAFLQNDFNKKRTRYSHMITSTGNMSHKKGAAAALAAAAASMGLEDATITIPVEGGTKRRKGTAAANASATTGATSSTAASPSNIATAASNNLALNVDPSSSKRQSSTGKTAQSGAGRGASKFIPAAAPTIGQVVCTCKQVYDGTPIVPQMPISSMNDATGAIGPSMTDSAATTDAMNQPTPGATPIAPLASLSIGENTPMDTSDPTGTGSSNRGMGAHSGNDPISNLSPPSLPTISHPHLSNHVDVSSSLNSPSNDSSASTSFSSSTSSTNSVQPPTPFLIPCQRCPRWFHPSCLRLNPLEALTPYICAKHSDAHPPPLRALTRPTTSRHERALEREKAAELAAPPAQLTPGSGYYLPEPSKPCPPLPDDMDDARDSRLFHALRDMMSEYHLSQHDVCISSNLSGGQAALSSMINARKIANIGRKQNQLRKWLWKFEEWQRARADHSQRHPHLPRPIAGQPIPIELAPISPITGAPMIAGSVVAGQVNEWPAKINWKSYFEPLTPEELAKQQLLDQQEQAKLPITRPHRSSIGTLSASTPVPLTSSTLSSNHPPTDSTPLSSSAPIVTPTAGEMPRLRTVHHPPLKYVQSPDAEEMQGSNTETVRTPTTVGSNKRKSGEFNLESLADESGLLSLPSSKFTVGDKLDIKSTPNSDSPWLSATVRQIRSGAILCHFLRTPDQYDQWVSVPSSAKRVAVYGSQALEKKRQAARPGWDLEDSARTAWRQYHQAEKQALKDGITTGAPGWSGKRLTGAAAAAAAKRKEQGLDEANADDPLSDDVNTNADECVVCGRGGSLICCDSCPRSYHAACCTPPVNMKQLAASEEEWICSKCQQIKAKKRKLNNNNSMED